jgi:type I restriction enzyme S subunit
MASEWSTLTLRAANITLIDCDHRTPPASATGYPYVTIPQLRNGRIDLAEARRITAEHFAEWTRKALPTENDVVLSRRCNPGETAFVATNMQFALGQNLVLLRADGTKVYPPFLRWLVRGQGWWEQIKKFLNVGAVFDSLKCADVPNFELMIPPMEEQRAIANVLGTLDEKIDLNRRMNETLEGMARALFKSWFVDFCPVHAKQTGGECGIPKDVADLFPSSLEKSEIGYIPKGWAVSPLLSDCKLLSGGTPKTHREEYWNGDIPWASAKDVSQAKHTFLITTERAITRRGLEESTTQLIPAMSTVIVARGATTGRMVILGCDMAMNQTCYAVRSNSKTPFTLYCLLRHSIASLVHAAHGSVFDTITTRTFAQARVVEIPQALKARYEALVSPMFERTLVNTEQSRTLALLRDNLLPKLISGELRVSDAERIVSCSA